VGLLLQAVDVVDPYRWRWELREATSRDRRGPGQSTTSDRVSGGVLADHTVVLDGASWEVAAFTDLYGYLRWHADPDRRVEHETQLIHRLGEWITTRVLGAHIADEIAAAAPVTVCVQVPPQADFLLLRPLELAHVDGAALARHGDIAVVFDVGSPGRRKQPVGTGCGCWPFSANRPQPQRWACAGNGMS
jgi:hypothetical protein